jgi:PAS domain S-box-containing protein
VSSAPSEPVVHPRDLSGIPASDNFRERFIFATDAADIGYFFCDLPFEKLNWDNRVKRHFWLDPDADVDIEMFYRRLHPDDRERTREAIEQAILAGKHYDIEYRTVSPVTGEIRWIRAIGRVAYGPTGVPVRFDGITQDITARKRTETELIESEGRIRVALKNVPVILYTADRDLRYTWIYRSHPLVSAEALIGRRDDEVAPGITDELVAFKQSVVDSGAPGRREITFDVNGTSETYDLYAEPLHDSQGNVVGLTVAALDITQTRLAEEALRRAEKLAVVGRLASSIAHEINNPLESVVNSLYLMRNSGDPGELQFLIRTAEEELARVSHVVTHSLRFNRQSTAPTEQDLSAIADSALALYSGRLRHAPIRLLRDYRPTDPLLCFEGELRQVFANLIGNAIDATRAGKIQIRIREARQVCDGSTCIRVSIGDTGSGIDPKIVGRLFEPFVTTKENTGTGLGLWVTAEILRRHGAKVQVRTSTSPHHNGTVFVITFPRMPGGPTPATAVAG